MYENALTRYRGLVTRLDAFSEQAAAACLAHLACKPGCDSCCRKSFTIFRIEARNLREGFELLGAPARDQILRSCRENGNGMSACVLLKGGLCMLYEHRPIICRTHGLPFISSNLTINGEKRVSLCEKNFTAPGSLEQLPPGLILDLDTLNTMLSALNMLYMKETGDIRHAAERVRIPDIFLAK